MKQKFSHYQQKVRRSSIENYFLERRMSLLNYREREIINNRNLNPCYTHRQYHSWKQVVLQGVREQQSEVYYRSRGGEEEEMDFQINLTSIQAGWYYLNFLKDGAPYNYLEETVYLLGKLINKLLFVDFKLTPSEQNERISIIVQVLSQILLYLKVNQEHFSETNVPNFKNSNLTKRVLSNLLEQQFRVLLQTQDGMIVREVLSIAFELSRNYLVYPNYQVVRYIITKIVAKQHLFELVQSKGDNSQNFDQFNDKIQELLMKFVIYFRLEESTNRKAKNIHYLQVIHQFYSYVEYSLVNICEFVRNNDHGFDYQHINNNLYFTLTLFTQIIHKFKSSLKDLDNQSPNPLILIKPAILEQLYNITYIHSRREVVQRQQDQFILTIEESVFKVFRYIMGEQQKQRNPNNKIYNRRQEWEITGNDRYILDILTVINMYLKEIEEKSRL